MTLLFDEAFALEAQRCPRCGRVKPLDPEGCCSFCGQPRSLDAVRRSLAESRARCLAFRAPLELALEAVERAGLPVRDRPAASRSRLH